MFGVRCVPSLLFFRGGQKIDGITGADDEMIRQIFAKCTVGDKLRGNVLGCMIRYTFILDPYYHFISLMKICL